MRNEAAQVSVVVFCAAVAAAFALRAEQIAVPMDETMVMGVTNAMVSVRPAVEGTLRKEGLALLTLDDADIPNGHAEVREGALELVATNGSAAAALPAWVRQAAVLWFDANINAVTGTDTNGVVQWLDAR